MKIYIEDVIVKAIYELRKHEIGPMPSITMNDILAYADAVIAFMKSQGMEAKIVFNSESLENFLEENKSIWSRVNKKDDEEDVIVFNEDENDLLDKVTDNEIVFNTNDENLIYKLQEIDKKLPKEVNTALGNPQLTKNVLFKRINDRKIASARVSA